MLCWYKWVVNVLVLLLVQLYLFDFCKERINTFKLLQIIWIIFSDLYFLRRNKSVDNSNIGFKVHWFSFFLNIYFTKLLGGLLVYLITIFPPLNLFKVNGRSTRTRLALNLKFDRFTLSQYS